MIFNHELPAWKVQDIELATQYEFIAIKQYDGGNPDTTHWVLVRKSQIQELIALLQQAEEMENTSWREVVGVLVDSATEEGQ